jgi:hypothetical protein
MAGGTQPPFHADMGVLPHLKGISTTIQPCLDPHQQAPVMSHQMSMSHPPQSVTHGNSYVHVSTPQSVTQGHPSSISSSFSVIQDEGSVATMIDTYHPTSAMNLMMLSMEVPPVPQGLALATLAPATMLPPLNDTQDFTKWLLKVRAILHANHWNGITNQNTDSLAFESLSSELYMLLINCLDGDMLEPYIQGVTASFANQGILMLHDLISTHQSTSSAGLVSVFTRFLQARMLTKLYIGMACHSDMTSPSRLPSIQETCVPTAKFTQSVKVDTSHIGIADSGATDHFFRKSHISLHTLPCMANLS